MSMTMSTNYPGPVPWLEAAAQTIPHQPSDVNRAKNIEGFGVFSDLIGQAVAQTDPAVRAEQIGAARLHLAPLWIALAAAEAILTDVEGLPARKGKDKARA